MQNNSKTIHNNSSKQAQSEKQELTEQYVLEKFLQCIPERDPTQISEIIQKSQQQYVTLYQQQIQQPNFQNNSSENYDDIFNTKQHNISSDFTFNTPQLTKIVIDKIISSLIVPNDNQDVQLHLMHMRNIGLEQEKTIQRAIMEGDKSQCNRKTFEFTSIFREDPQNYCIKYYKKQFKLQQKFSNNFKHPQIKQQDDNDYLSNDIKTTNRSQLDKFNNKDPSSISIPQRDNNNILSSRCSNNSYNAANTIKNQKNISEKTHNTSNELPQQNKIEQSQHDNDKYKQALSLQQKMISKQNIKSESEQEKNIKIENIQQINIKFENEYQNEHSDNKYERLFSKKKQHSQHRRIKENKINTNSYEKENTSYCERIIYKKISKENINKKKEQTYICQNQSQVQQSFANMPNNNITQTNILPQHNNQQQNVTTTNYINSVPIIQQTALIPQYAMQPQPFYNNTIGCRTIYSPIYYNQQPYMNQSQIPIGVVNHPIVYNNPDCNSYYQHPQQKIRNSEYSSHQSNFNGSNNTNRCNGQMLYAKQNNYNEENVDIDNQNQAHLNEFNHNNTLSSQSNYEEFFKNQYFNQQTLLQSHLSEQNFLQQQSLENLDVVEVDEILNTHYNN